MQDAELARHCAERAAVVLRAIRAAGATGAEGDSRANRTILEILAAERPEDAVLSEESADDPVRLASRRVWIIDPLDGTREFGDAGRGDWAVHVALWQNGELTAGAVALPAEDVVLTADSPPPRRPTPDGSVRIAVSRSRPASFLPRVAEMLGGTLVPLGSAGYKTCAVVRGEVDAYLHAGGQYEWDSAAPVAVARSAGLHTCRIDGSPLVYNRPDPFLPDLVVCRPELTEPVLAALHEVAVSTGAQA